MIDRLLRDRVQILQLRQKARAASRRRTATAMTTGRFCMGRTSWIE
jgi:hypothetical protein